MNTKSIKTALRANALFSLTCSLLLLSFTEPLSGMTNIPIMALQVVGVGLLLFVISLLLTARKPVKGMVKSIIIQDWSWVVGSAVIVSFDLFDISTQGKWALVVIALFVASFAIWQQKTSH